MPASSGSTSPRGGPRTACYNHGLSRRLAQVLLVALGATAASGIASWACSSFEPESALDPGSEGGDTRAPPEDAVAAPDASSEASLDANAKCDTRGIFDPPALLAGLNTSFGDYGARLTPDELTVYFSSARSTGTEYDIFSATRTSLASTFGTPMRVAALSTVARDDGYPSISSDGLEIFLSRAVSTAATYDVYRASRAKIDAGFGAPALLASVNDPGSADLQPFVAQNGDLYFESARRALTGNDIFFAPRVDGGTFGTPQAIEELATPSVDGTPVLSFDMLTIYFMSARTDNNGDPAGDIWVAHRTSLSAPFGDIKRVAELNTKGDIEFPTWLSADNCRLYMGSQHNGLYQTYVATRRP